MANLPRWTPERRVDVERAGDLVGRAFPELRGRPVVALAEGWDNTVVLVDEIWAFRFPRRSIALPGFRRELAVLPGIGPLVPLPIPVPVLIATDDDPRDPWPFAGYRLIPGRELAETGLDESARLDAAATLGEFLRVLHAHGTAGLDLPVDPNERSWPRARIDDTRELLNGLVTNGLWAGDPAIEALLADAERLDPSATEPVLVHGDLHVRHLLVDDAGRAAGVIDWGDLCLADPAVDLAFAYAAFSGPARAAHFAAYGPVNPERELRARALAIRLSAILADYAAADGRPALLAESLAGLHRAVN
jgi:aminoglycoside phosphotransferase (APT) family kinase protein